MALVDRGRNRQGPTLRRLIERKVAQGELSEDTLVWQLGMSDWLPMAETFDFETPPTIP